MPIVSTHGVDRSDNQNALPCAIVIEILTLLKLSDATRFWKSSPLDLQLSAEPVPSLPSMSPRELFLMKNMKN
ncbi:hypothetical protein EMCG_03919 [[Emmonsia] crescens]|uniref:Uncharacterized protein n=1 Tax=[Emmonsia] crescens TaxID=73230 RepID=A0A0G2HTL8_9EURO|nr:hypothetical protein EMCG_03919 [Emmonsia crescens UAMH 3008]